jgi:hypothetical protein
MRYKIYIASPYTNGNKLELVRLQIDAWHVLQDLGYYAIPPLLSHYINEVRERPWNEWLDYDFETISMCDAVIRLRPKDKNGVEIPSAGADKEKVEALRLGLMYLEFETVEQMKEALQKNPIRIISTTIK